MTGPADGSPCHSGVGTVTASNHSVKVIQPGRLIDGLGGPLLNNMAVEADLLVVDGDPTQDIAALRKVTAVFQGGKLVGGEA